MTVSFEIAQTIKWREAESSDCIVSDTIAHHSNDWENSSEGEYISFDICRQEQDSYGLGAEFVSSVYKLRVIWSSVVIYPLDGNGDTLLNDSAFNCGTFHSVESAKEYCQFVLYCWQKYGDLRLLPIAEVI